MASGDGYSRRYDEVVAHIGNKTKCVDDTLLWADTIEESYFQVIQWLDVCGRNGIILNPEKFVFSAPMVEFAGFTITMTYDHAAATWMRSVTFQSHVTSPTSGHGSGWSTRWPTPSAWLNACNRFADSCRTEYASSGPRSWRT